MPNAEMISEKSAFSPTIGFPIVTGPSIGVAAD